MKPKSKTEPSNDLPALRNFVRGYFHQDMKDEYGSAKGALLAFCEDASANEKAALARDWSQLMAAEAGQPIEHLNQTLTQKLGSSYSVTADEVQQMTTILKALSKTS
jgi:CdiI immunity protein